MRSQQHMILPFTCPARGWYGISTSCYKIGIDFKFDENLQAEGYLSVEVSIKVMTGLVIFLVEDNALSGVFQLCTQSCTTRTVDQILQEGDRRWKNSLYQMQKRYTLTICLIRVVGRH